MGGAEVFDRESTLLVARGLYVLRYESGADGLEAPAAYVQAAPGFEDAINIISAPGAAAGQLDGPGAALLLRACEHASLKIGVRRKSVSGSLEAALKLESVGGLQVVSPSQAPRARLHAVATDRAEAAVDMAAQTLFIAHLARRGDISVSGGEWAAGPAAPAKIEGIEVRDPKLEGVELQVQALSAGGGTPWSRWAGAGQFVGTRGKNLPLVGLRFRLTGAASRRYVLSADALFLGASVVNRSGLDVEFFAPAGRDPLVGVRLAIRPERRASGWQEAKPLAEGVERRIRVFKATAI